jgi:hypothetical protein
MELYRVTVYSNPPSEPLFHEVIISAANEADANQKALAFIEQNGRWTPPKPKFNPKAELISSLTLYNGTIIEPIPQKEMTLSEEVPKALTGLLDALSNSADDETKRIAQELRRALKALVTELIRQKLRASK